RYSPAPRVRVPRARRARRERAARRRVREPAAVRGAPRRRGRRSRRGALGVRLRRAGDVPPADAPPPEWEHVPEGWGRRAGGWDVDAIARVYRDHWPSFLAAVAGPGPLGVNHEVPAGRPVSRDELDAQQVVLAFAYALARAARGRDRLSLLDWGG